MIDFEYCVSGVTVSNPTHGTFFKPAPMVQRPGVRKRRWRPGAQALREIRNYMRTTNLVIPRTPFLWYVEHVEQ